MVESMTDEEFFTLASFAAVVRERVTIEREKIMKRHGWQIVMGKNYRDKPKAFWKDPKTGKLHGIHGDAFQLFQNRFLRSVRMGMACQGCALSRVGLMGKHRKGCSHA